MKRIFIVLALLTACLSLFAQEDVVKFLGIPVDGTKEAMINKLKEKGFISNPLNKDVLIGEFNGKQSLLHFVTNKNKLWRVMVMDVDGVSEQQIRIRYNKLGSQFLGNGKYILADFSDTYTISEDEDLSYEMSIHKKQYAASFYQLPESLEDLMKGKDGDTIRDAIRGDLLSRYTEEQLADPDDEVNTDVMVTTLSYLQVKYRNSLVWYTISESFGKFYIAIYYDNENNRAIGEDL